MLMEEFGKMNDAQERWKGELEDKMDRWKEELREDQKRWKEEMKSHFDVVAENIVHDFASANREEIDVLKDRSKVHEKRIVRLERSVGLVAG